MDSLGRVVKTGTFVYAETVECDVCIVHSNVRYGTGDEDDPPGIESDAAIDSYYVLYGSTVQRGTFTSTSAAYDTLREAELGAELQLGSQARVRWHEAVAADAGEA